MIDRTDAELADELTRLIQEAHGWQEPPRRIRIGRRIAEWLGLSRRHITFDGLNSLEITRIMAEIERRRRYRTDFRPDRPTRRPELQFAHLAPPPRRTPADL